jgi:serine/threonine-protein kinase
MILRGRYVLNESIGEGGFAQVFSAQDRFTDRRVALKYPKADLDIEHIRRESEILWSVHHHGICHGYLDRDDVTGISFLVIEEAGVSLSRYLSDEDPDESEMLVLAREVGRAVASALDFLHDLHNLLHLDVSPENIMLGQDLKLKRRTIRLIDFGVAARAAWTIRDGTSTLRPSQVHGFKQLFSAPELISGQKSKVGRRADQYSLAVVMQQIVEPLQHERWGKMRKALRRGYDHDPKQRYENCAAMIAAVEKSIPKGFL